MTGVCCWLGLALVAAGMAQTDFHTPPDQWKAPRLFHLGVETSPDNSVYRSRPVIGHVLRPLDGAPRVLSPNKAYWFSVSPAGCPDAGATPARTIHVFTERPAILELTLGKADCRYETSAKWVNEKIIFVRVWWGRLAGSDLLVDVETEKILYHEIVQDGAIAFQQSRGQGSDEKPATRPPRH
ncbi:MAG: hypothetical protein M9913_23155 [Bryobacteraceae bacterium]|nr:hypothetical protein [Solibacteraceae bacterium]MCO5353738.1 hypothetical protein [Bryobacteraceae bacterium]